ncbi:TetR/AcrR family transcriptional regulator [Sphingomonas sp. So64.6b]|uniref:TetR/AcrR family transcriptional regulator n=1 Tax=Sphingomonas sp. So64.6b TaxID=2997354 RepID=UPI001FCED179|nr:TetR/AcrR family transcriptional regulator [Sphingomonas sp. So64.6b]
MIPPLNFAIDNPTRAELRRRKILDCASKLFVDHGFHATGVAQISALSGVAVGQIYRDFASKEDIVVAIVQDDCAEFMAHDVLKEAIDRGDRVAVRDWLHQFVSPKPERDDDGGRLFAEIIAESSRNERIAGIFSGILADSHTMMLEALEMLSEGKGSPKEKEDLADMIPTLSLGLMHHHLMRPDLDVDTLAASFARIIDRELDALRAGAAGSEPAIESR